MQVIDPIEELKSRQGDRSLRDLAREIECSPAYLSDIYHHRRDPGPIILEYLGLDVIITPASKTYMRKGDK